ncbi:MAG TPA: sugar ABC transporter substrate-binding protein [Chloroflexota bacterium]|nr:sugar ABC transporter substrate-binding protein [Chloroflexota bacterium]
MQVPEKRRLSRRQVLSLVALTGLFPLVEACTTASPPTPIPPPPPAQSAKSASPIAAAAPTAASQPAATSKITLHALYSSNDPYDHQVFVQLFDLFGQKNPGLTVDFNDTPLSGFVQKATTMIVGGTPPDVMYLHPSFFLNFVYAKQVRDLTDMVKPNRSAYIPVQLDFWTFQGRLYGLPYNSNPSIMYYNKTIFQKRGVKTPEEYEKAGAWTWDQLRALAQQVSSGTGASRVFGYAADPSGLQFYTCVPVWDNQGELTNPEQTKWLLDTQPVIDVMQWHADMFLKEKTMPMPSDQQGTVWFFLTGRVGISTGGKNNVIQAANAKLDFEIGQVGTPKGKVGPINRDGPLASGIPLGGKYTDDAYRLVYFLGSPDAAPVYLGTGRGLPVQTSLINSEWFTKALKPWERAEVYANAAATVRAWIVPGKNPNEENRTFATEWQKVLAGQSSVPAAMTEATQTMNTQLT